jgi:hypothetical protein
LSVIYPNFSKCEMKYSKYLLLLSIAILFAQFLFAQDPTITSFTPTYLISNSAGNYQVIITGTNFVGVTDLTFGGVEVASGSYNVVNSTTISAFVTNVKSGDVVVTTSDGIASLGGFAYCTNSSGNSIISSSGEPSCIGTSTLKVLGAASSSGIMWYFGDRLVQSSQDTTYTPLSYGNYFALVVSDTGCTASNSGIAVTQPAASVILTGDPNYVAGRTFSFIAIPTFGGTSPTYSFAVNNNPVQNSSSNIYKTGTLNINDKISCTLTSNYPCGSVLTALSNTITMTTGIGVITTVAGGGTDTTDNGIPATKAAFYQPQGLFVDKGDNIYIADANGYRVRKVDTSGIITTIAGNGQGGPIGGGGGDGGLATAATLGIPDGVYVDTTGNVYIATFLEYRIRKVNTNGIITTFAGNGNQGYSGDGGQATSASIGWMQGIGGDDSGNIYLPDIFNAVVRKINKEGIISTIAGTAVEGYSGDNGLATEAELGEPNSVSLDRAGNIYIGDDYPNNVVRKINTSGIITTVAGSGNTNDSYFSGEDSGDGGPATAAFFNDIECAFADSSGNIYIADESPNPTGNNKIRKVSISDTISSVAGIGFRGFSRDTIFSTNSELNSPETVITDKYGDIYVADWGNARIRKITIPAYTIKAGNWSDPTVWSKGKVPDAFTQVTIDNPVTIDIHASAYSIFLQKSNLLTIKSNASLNIIGHYP